MVGFPLVKNGEISVTTKAEYGGRVVDHPGFYSSADDSQHIVLGYHLSFLRKPLGLNMVISICLSNHERSCPAGASTGALGWSCTSSALVCRL